MKQLFILAMLLAPAGLLPAQNFASQKLLDELAKHPQHDSFRVNRFNLLSIDNTFSIHARDSFVQRAYTLAAEIGYKAGTVEAIIRMADLKRFQGQTDTALHLARTAYNMAKELGSQRLQASALDQMAVVQMNTSDVKEAISLLLKAEAMAVQLHDRRLLAKIQDDIAFYYIEHQGNYPAGMEWVIRLAKTAGEANCLSCTFNAWQHFAAIYSYIGDHKKSLYYLNKAIQANAALGNGPNSALLNNLGETYRLMDRYPEAVLYYRQALAAKSSLALRAIIWSNLADTYVRMDSLAPAFHYAFRSLETAGGLEDMVVVAWVDGILARAYLKRNMPDSTLYYATRGLQAARHTGSLESMRTNAGLLSEAFLAKQHYKQAYEYNQLFIHYRDSMSGAEVANRTNLLQFQYNKEKTEAQIALLNEQKQAQRYQLVGAIILVLLIMSVAVMLYRNNRQKQKANERLRQQKQEIESQRDQTKRALAELQDAQQQLIHAEKMASLGELTAGIAHEIQNPLNFVNNFSEVSNELLDELNTELVDGNAAQAAGIVEDLKGNLHKINHHGQRASAIVRGMLQHARKTTGGKVPTDINALVDEYLHLSYHALAMKDPSFTARLITDYDPAAGLIQLIPQEMGRVLLNLFNNALDATYEKYREAGDGDARFVPQVSVCTLRQGDELLVTITDNGKGIAAANLDKIFQPFFTTKPSGQGTGLGLSLSYDIIKLHKGNISVRSEPGDGTSFIISVPCGMDVQPPANLQHTGT